MKSLRLWLCTALIAGGLFTEARADQSDAARTFGDLSTPFRLHTRLPARAAWFRPLTPVEVVFRAQSPDDGGVPVPGLAGDETEPTDSALSATDPVTADSAIVLPDPTTWNAFSPPIGPDPFINGGVVGAQPYAPYAPFGPGPGGPAAPGISTFGTCGPQPYRFGWQHRFDTHLIPHANVSGGSVGSLKEFGTDFDLLHTAPFMPGWILTCTNQFRLRTWDGPSGGAGLPGSAFRFGWDFKLETPQSGPFSVGLGITPSLNSDLDAPISSEAFQLDGRGIVWWQLDRFWTLGLGAMYWDRVSDRVLPMAGLIYRDDYWEWRLLFPEAEIRLFAGNEPWWSKWIYVRAKYIVEAYEISTAAGGRDEVELEDWQLMLGYQMDAGLYRWFIEGGLLLDRDLQYRRNPGSTADTSFITRLGWRY